ncbi:MAG: fibronectin type III domain-containing protein, partial [Nitrosopumilaceae archaeon]|nr:fibronectin type III domain-containing protein [Nitrosopumilaceae archaeon]
MVPAIPTGLSAKTTTTSAKISWNAPANNGYIITGYQIQRNGTILVQNTANTRLSYVDLGLKPLSTQTYRVAAWNIAGLGPFSANITAKTSNQTGIDNLG